MPCELSQMRSSSYDHARRLSIKRLPAAVRGRRLALREQNAFYTALNDCVSACVTALVFNKTTRAKPTLDPPLYNVHTQANQDGEIRGQIRK